jgi:hypothetical protein
MAYISYTLSTFTGFMVMNITYLISGATHDGCITLGLNNNTTNQLAISHGAPTYEEMVESTRHIKYLSRDDKQAPSDQEGSQDIEVERMHCV